ncbi:sugar ABC transporter ATP-binding protein [Ensifer sp. LCM 4579]|nr:sugar ABC transporter ATP-binding protein [Ensifer sp. LCM 4579]
MPVLSLDTTLPCEPGSQGKAARPLLQLDGICKSFGGFQALTDVTFDLRPGEVHVLFGENGAGKSTLIQILCGVQKFDSGRYELFGQDIAGLSPAEARRRGISVVFQEFSLIPEMTVEENLYLGHELTRAGRLDKSEMRTRVRVVLDRLGFDLSPAARVSGLRRAQQQMVEIAKALLLECRVLVLDEPTASLTDHEAGQLLAMVEQLRGEGLGIIYVSHRMAEIDRLADRITVLRDGRHIATLPRERASHGELVELMTGRTFEKFYPEIRRDPGPVRLRIEGLSLPRGLAKNVSFEVRGGEVLGLAGLAGCGKSEVIRAAFGLEKSSGGKIEIGGRRLYHHGPREAIAAGICYLPSDRSREGLAMHQSIGANATMAALDVPKFSRRGFGLRLKAERAFTSEIVDRLKIRTPDLDATPDQLSGGNKQKVMIARGMSRDFDIYLFDEPTVGVDVQAKLQIYDVIKALAESGKAVVVASSELAEVLHLSHRLLVMREGRIVGLLEGAEATEDAVLSLFFDKRAAKEERGIR